MKRFTIAATALVALLIAACSKNSDSGNPAAPVSVISAHIWKIDTIGFDTDGNGLLDAGIPGGLKACDLDNTLSFKSDSTGVFDEGTLKCIASSVQSVPFKWNFSNGDSVINITGNIPGQLNGNINVIALSDTSFIMSKKVPYANDATVGLIISLKK